jgi:hypothetical protein
MASTKKVRAKSKNATRVRSAKTGGEARAFDFERFAGALPDRRPAEAIIADLRNRWRPH